MNSIYIYDNFISCNFVKFQSMWNNIVSTFSLMSLESTRRRQLNLWMIKSIVYIRVIWIPYFRLNHFRQLNRVFHKLSAIQECQHCQLTFSCSVRNELHQWSLQLWNKIFSTHWHQILHLPKYVNIWQYKVDNNANIANFVHLWKTRLFAKSPS